MLFLDGVYIDGQKGGAARFRQVKAPGTAQLTHTIAHRIGRYLERQDISWPAQALSYKLGEYTIWQLRNEAESRLGATLTYAIFMISSWHWVRCHLMCSRMKSVAG
jgi:hypothetical protein